MITSETSKHQNIIEDLQQRPDEELLFMASIIRLILDDRGVYYPSRESGNFEVKQ